MLLQAKWCTLLTPQKLQSSSVPVKSSAAEPSSPQRKAAAAEEADAAVAAPPSPSPSPQQPARTSSPSHKRQKLQQPAAKPRIKSVDTLDQAEQLDLSKGKQSASNIPRAQQVMNQPQAVTQPPAMTKQGVSQRRKMREEGSQQQGGTHPAAAEQPETPKEQAQQLREPSPFLTSFAKMFGNRLSSGSNSNGSKQSSPLPAHLASGSLSSQVSIGQMDSRPEAAWKLRHLDSDARSQAQPQLDPEILPEAEQFSEQEIDPDEMAIQPAELPAAAKLEPAEESDRWDSDSSVSGLSDALAEASGQQELEAFLGVQTAKADVAQPEASDQSVPAAGTTSAQVQRVAAVNAMMNADLLTHGLHA